MMGLVLVLLVVILVSAAVVTTSVVIHAIQRSLPGKKDDPKPLWCKKNPQTPPPPTCGEKHPTVEDVTCEWDPLHLGAHGTARGHDWIDQLVLGEPIGPEPAPKSVVLQPGQTLVPLPPTDPGPDHREQLVAELRKDNDQLTERLRETTRRLEQISLELEERRKRKPLHPTGMELMGQAFDDHGHFNYYRQRVAGRQACDRCGTEVRAWGGERVRAHKDWRMAHNMCDHCEKSWTAAEDRDYIL